MCRLLFGETRVMVTYSWDWKIWVFLQDSNNLHYFTEIYIDVDNSLRKKLFGYLLSSRRKQKWERQRERHMITNNKINLKCDLSNWVFCTISEVLFHFTGRYKRSFQFSHDLRVSDINSPTYFIIRSLKLLKIYFIALRKLFSLSGFWHETHLLFTYRNV